MLSALLNFRCLRTHRWKYVRHINDLEKDPLEQHNLSNENGEAGRKRRDLARELDLRWREGIWRR